ncbi:efflux transporter outer membrane subunit [Sphingomonas sp.]|uniref:efflux transporter outer membrane subunit n=1 Tax=Sphingomonas sp. TaxID=28214 RepID=UPI003AFF6205
MKRFVPATLIASLLAAACATPRDTPRVGQATSGTLGLGTASTAINAEWWRAFGDPQLDRLIAMALAGNPSLDEALARIRVAAAQAEGERESLKPQVTGAGQLNRARVGDKFAPPPIGGHDTNIAIALGNLSWDLDLFGRRRALVARAAATAQAARLDAAQARLAVSVSLAQAYVGLARADKLVAVTGDFVATRRQAVGFVQSRIRNQLASQFELRAAETLLAEAEQARTQAVGQREVLVHAIAALAGRGADFYPRIVSPALALDRAPPVPATLPADLLGRRPDLLAGRARIDAAVQGRKAAAAAFLPDISISALAGLTAVGLSNVVSGGAFTYSVGPAVTLPIFEGGRLRAQYRSATADLDAAVASYNDAVLGAVREAADAISTVRAGDRALQDQDHIVAGLRGTVALDEVRFRNGLGSRLDAIDSGFRLLEAEQALVGFQADALTRRVQLVAALGGGFDPVLAQGPALTDNPS